MDDQEFFVKIKKPTPIPLMLLIFTVNNAEEGTELTVKVIMIK